MSMKDAAPRSFIEAGQDALFGKLALEAQGYAFIQQILDLHLYSDLLVFLGRGAQEFEEPPG